MKETAEILKERGEEYGDYGELADMAQTLKIALARGKSSGKLSFVQLESLDMICSKMARIVCGNPNNRDSWQDISGYAHLVAKRLDY